VKAAEWCLLLLAADLADGLRVPTLEPSGRRRRRKNMVAATAGLSSPAGCSFC